MSNMRSLVNVRWQALSPPGCRGRCSATLWRQALSTCAFTVEGDLTQLAPGEIPTLGVEAAVSHTFTIDHTRRFAELNRDSNPIHTDPAFAQREAGVNAPIVQGMLSASLFATIFGRTIPGCVYVSQDFRFRTPLLVDEPVRARVKVVKLRKRFVDCETVCEKIHDGAIVVEGKAIVLLPSPPPIETND